MKNMDISIARGQKQLACFVGGLDALFGVVSGFVNPLLLDRQAVNGLSKDALDSVIEKVGLLVRENPGLFAGAIPQNGMRELDEVLSDEAANFTKRVVVGRADLVLGSNAYRVLKTFAGQYPYDETAIGAPNKVS